MEAVFEADRSSAIPDGSLSNVLAGTTAGGGPLAAWLTAALICVTVFLALGCLKQLLNEIKGEPWLPNVSLLALYDRFVLVRRADAAARKKGLATNTEVFAFPLNQKVEEHFVPLSKGQREDGFWKHEMWDGSKKLMPLRRAQRKLVPRDRRITEYLGKDVVIGLGHKCLTAVKEDGRYSLMMDFKDVAEFPLEARWRFVPADVCEKTSDTPLLDGSPTGSASEFWNIKSVSFPGMALTCEASAGSLLRLEPLQSGNQAQIFRFTSESNILPGMRQNETAVWVTGTKHDVVQVVLRNMDAAVPLNYTQWADRDAGDLVTVTVKSERKLMWSVFPEGEHLLLLPRLLRTTHAQSIHFHVHGDDIVTSEVERGPETLTPLKGTTLVAYSPLLPFILGAAEGSWQKDKFWALCQLLGCPLIDRTKTLSCQLKLEVQHPIPIKTADPGPLLELMRSRARELLDHHDPSIGPLQILWSGGIDTTASICAFLQVCGDGEAREKLVIRYCARSVHEYPSFFDRFIRELPHKEIDGHVRDAFADGPTVTGDPADMLMGTFVMAQAFHGRTVNGKANPLHFALEKPWEDVIPKWVHAQGLMVGHEPSEELAGYKVAERDWLEWMRPFVKAAPIKITTVFDWLWWVTYACKYEHDVTRVFYNREEVTERIRQNVINFYEPECFHQWSFFHHAEKMPDKRLWASYKLPLKKIILDHTSDRSYFAAKTKVASVRNSWGHILGITDEWEVIRFGAFSVSLRRMRQKYGKELDRFVQPQALAARQRRSGFSSSVGDVMHLESAAALVNDAGFPSFADFMHAEVLAEPPVEYGCGSSKGATDPKRGSRRRSSGGGE
eukprot:TRINITY_DN35484_c0_g2_i1.p1 TRINITY_DN35484_c0_g2~~TRINITY_DN35484_c0_g2_i1.p1  ORF type:complete len:841 (+),score=127.23 TRINITY_DN35484_c0_g2_i1:123-2645(+)